MTDAKNTKAESALGGGDTRILGRRADPAIKETRPQVADKDRVRTAISEISDLEARLAMLDEAASGPFGSTGENEVDFSSGKVDALLDDTPEPAGPAALKDQEPADDPVPADAVSDTATPMAEDEDEADVPLDDLLGNPLPAADEAIEVTPISTTEVAAQEDEDYNASVDAFLAEMGEDGLLDVNEDPEDPIDAMVDAGLMRDPVSGEDAASPFAALFSPVSDGGDMLDDAGLPEDGDDLETADGGQAQTGDVYPAVHAEDDQDLFFDDMPHSVEEMRDAEAAHKTLPGAGSFAGEDEDPVDAGAGEEAAAPDAGLPELKLGGDDAFYAPGTSYADEDEAHSSGDDVVDEPVRDDSDLPEIEQNIEKDDEMAISVNGTGAEEKASEDRETGPGNLAGEPAFDAGENTFDAEGLDDLIAGEDETGAAGMDEALLDEVLADPEDGESGDEGGSDAVDAIFGDAKADEDVATSEDAAADADEPPAGAQPVPVEEEHLGDAAEDGPAEPAKKGKGKTLLLVAASVAVLGGVGFAGLNGMIPGLSLGGGNVFGNTPAPSVAATDETQRPAMPEIGMTDPSDEAGAGKDPAQPGVIRLSDLIDTEAERSPALQDPLTDLRQELSGLMDPVGEVDPDMAGDAGSVEPAERQAADGGADPSGMPVDLAGIGAEMADPVEADPADPVEIAADGGAPQEDTPADESAADPVETPDVAGVDGAAETEVPDPISELAAQIRIGKDGSIETNDPVAEAPAGALFAEDGRVAEIEKNVAALGSRLDGLTGEIAQMNDLIMQAMERNSLISDRVESNERSLRGVSAILTEFAKVRESLDQTQIVLLDIAARVGSLEASNPADRDEVAEALKEIDGEMKRLTANMAILARMTVNGVSAMKAEGASAGNHAVQTSSADMPAAGRDTVYAEDTEGFEAVTAPADAIPSDVSAGDFIEGYGYVLDVVPASGNQNLVVMENASVLVPK